MSSQQIGGQTRAFFGALLSSGNVPNWVHLHLAAQECALALLKQDCGRVARVLWAML